jgi:hypothetical protein
MRITTPVTLAEVRELTGAKALTIQKLRDGYLRHLAAGPLGSGKVTNPDGTMFYWTRDPETVHASLRHIDEASRA